MTFGNIFDGSYIVDIFLFGLLVVSAICLTISIVRTKIRDRKEDESDEQLSLEQDTTQQPEKSPEKKRIGEHVRLVKGPANWYVVECWYCGAEYYYELSYVEYDENDGDHNTECPWCHKLNEHSSEYGVWGGTENEPRER